MHVIPRDDYLHKLINRKENGSIKVITGLRRSGKSFLLFELYYHYLLSLGVKEEQIIKVELDNDEFEELTDYKKLGEYIRAKITDNGQYYVFLDEVQFCDNFEKVLNGLNKRKNLDIYITGSNSRFLSSDILTEFRGRGDEIRVFPLSFKEFIQVYNGDQLQAWQQYMMFGGMPRLVECKTAEDKSKYLSTLFQETYVKDVVERHKLKDRITVDTLLDILSSATGSITNPSKLSNTFQSVLKKKVSDNTIRAYISFIEDSFLISTAKRYDIRGKQYIGGKNKYYFTDIGLRNARLNFRQFEPTHIMENIIYNELIARGYNVDVGVVDILEKTDDGKYRKKSTEVDFICNMGNERIYVQSAFSLPDAAKVFQESRSLLNIKDSFRKIIVVGDLIPAYTTETGIKVINIQDFLLGNSSLDMY
ncbi:MAG: ATP-binding protein [Sphaerochaetaceae bacterium]